jgi:biotin synthase
MGIRAGANVVMPNLSPQSTRKQYALYDNKLSDGAEAAENKKALCRRIEAIGYEVVTARGDAKSTELS